MIDNSRPALRPRAREGEILKRVEELFASAGWRVKRQPASGREDLLVRRGRYEYAVEVEAAVESRRDRLVPLFAYAILEAHPLGQLPPGASPLAILVAPRLSERSIEELLQYAARVAPNVAVGVMDMDGRVEMRGPGLAGLKAVPAEPPLLKPAVLPRQPFDLFSDLNQWMLKVLLAPRVPLSLLSAPREALSSAASLAAAAHVSAPSAFRLLRHLSEDGWLDEVAPLRLVRVPELLRRWRAAAARPSREIRMRWLIPGRSGQLRQAVLKYNVEEHRKAKASGSSDWSGNARPRVCLGLYSAADALGFSHVRGVPHYLYLERLAPSVFNALGLSIAQPGDRVDVVLRVPRWPQALFRGAVAQDGVLVSDVLQVWLDVSEHPARGAEQADEIWKRAIKAIADEEVAR